LNAEIVRVPAQPSVKSRFFSAGTLVMASAPEQLDAMERSEMATLGKLIQQLGMGEQ